MSQWALPDADFSNAAWGDASGIVGNPKWPEIDEGFGAGRGSGSGPNDGAAGVSEQIRCSSTVGNGDLICTTSNVTDPGVSTGHLCRFRYAKDATGGKQLDYTFRLLQGATTKATLTATAYDSTAFTTGTLTLTGTEADSITDYTDLRLELVATFVGGGGGRSAIASAAEFECPDAAAAAKAPPPFQRRWRTVTRTRVY